MFNILVIRVYIALKCLWSRANALLREKRGEIELPNYVLSDLARAFLADIAEFFAVEANQAAYKMWKDQREESIKNTLEKG